MLAISYLSEPAYVIGFIYRLLALLLVNKNTNHTHSLEVESDADFVFQTTAVKRTRTHSKKEKSNVDLSKSGEFDRRVVFNMISLLKDRN